MNLKLFLLLTMTTIECVFVLDSKKYVGYQVFEIIPRTIYEVSWLNNASKKYSQELDFWNIPRIPNSRVRVMISPSFAKQFFSILNELKITFKIILLDVSKFQELNVKNGNHNEQLSLSYSMFSSKKYVKHMEFLTFLRYEEINVYLDHLAFMNAGQVTVENVGKSYEGRDIKTILLTNGDGNRNKSIIFIDAGMHAREWIAPSAALYVINQLVDNYKENWELLEDFDWLILPIVNPDGYEYTHTTDRFWRKTRSVNSETSCQGTDINRNFDFHWNTSHKHNSKNPCDDGYRGQGPFSEPETRIISAILNQFKERCKMYLSLHSFGSYLVYPWSWNETVPEKWKDLDDIAKAAREAIRIYNGRVYEIGSSSKVLFTSGGSSHDYAFGVVGIPITITMELSFGGSGFDPSASELKPLVEEAWVGIKAMSKQLAEKFSTSAEDDIDYD